MVTSERRWKSGRPMNAFKVSFICLARYLHVVEGEKELDWMTGKVENLQNPNTNLT